MIREQDLASLLKACDRLATKVLVSIPHQGFQCPGTSGSLGSLLTHLTEKIIVTGCTIKLFRKSIQEKHQKK